MNIGQLAIVTRAFEYGDRVAISDGSGEYTFDHLIRRSEQGASALLDGAKDLSEMRIASMISPSFDHVVAQWATWRAGGVWVPLCLTHPIPELEHALDTTTPQKLIVGPEYQEIIRPLAQVRGIEILTTNDFTANPVSLPDIDMSRRALILFTSGTTGKPKGVVSTHANIEHQIRSLISAWEWTDADRILLTLPLHHIHGIVNVVSCALWSGAYCQMERVFDRDEVAGLLGRGGFSLYMAVPTIYHKLIAWWEVASEEDRQMFARSTKSMRLMVSGSAALPVPTLERWKEITGQVLLERYGMTEIGMALANPLVGERLAGSVGRPLPGMEVRLADESDRLLTNDDSGEIQVRGPNIFLEYWERPEETKRSFTDDGWFKTGDIAVAEDNVYKILGRNSVDILKTGGEKVSALEIEAVLLAHPAVAEAAVVGLPDPEWGEKVVAAIVVRDAVPSSDLTNWCAERLAPYKVPKEFHSVAELPRNPMGKVMKPLVVELVNLG